MNWRGHNGGACPTDEKAMVMLRFRGWKNNSFESKNEHRASRVRWSHKGEPGDIIGYAVTSVPREDE